MTLVVRLQPNSEQYAKLKDTATEFASCCEFINSSVKPTLTDRNSIQAVIYNDAKSKFNLVSNHVIRVCARVGANRKTAKQKGKKVKGFKPTSFDCDKDTFTFREKDWICWHCCNPTESSIFTRMAGGHMNDIKGAKQHTVGKRYTHNIERKHLTYRTHIKLLARKTICFSLILANA